MNPEIFLASQRKEILKREQIYLGCNKYKVVINTKRKSKFDFLFVFKVSIKQ